MTNMKLLLSALCLLFSVSSLACDKPLRVAKSGSGKFSSEEKRGRDILSEVSCTIQTVEYDEFVTLDRRMALLVAGEIDLIIAVNKKPEREKGAYFSIAFGEERIRLWTLAENLDKYSGKQLDQLIEDGRRVIGPGFGWFGPVYQEQRETQSPQLIQYTHVPNGLALLLKGRGDVLLGSEGFSTYFPNEHRSKVRLLPQVVHRDGYHLMFSQKTVSADLVEKINDVIRQKSAGDD